MIFLSIIKTQLQKIKQLVSQNLSHLLKTVAPVFFSGGKNNIKKKKENI